MSHREAATRARVTPPIQIVAEAGGQLGQLHLSLEAIKLIVDGNGPSRQGPNSCAYRLKDDLRANHRTRL
jgi:hypothetical protein